jgi:hypothetical protein
MSEYERVERNVSFHSVDVAEVDDFWQVFLREIVRTDSSVEPGQSKVHCVGAVRDGSSYTFPVAGGRKQFGWFGHQPSIVHRLNLGKKVRMEP